MDNKKQKFLNNLREAGGIITDACHNSGVTRATYYNWRRADESFRLAADEVTEEQVDFVESRLMDKIRKGDTTSIIFYLKTKGRHHGYSEHRAPENISSVSAPDEDTNMRVKIRSKRDRIVRLLRSKGLYSEELSMQAYIAASLAVRIDMLTEEMSRPGYRPVRIELSREGYERESVNARESLYSELLRQLQRSLQALGMNKDARGVRADDDTLQRFLDGVNAEEEGRI